MLTGRAWWTRQDHLRDIKWYEKLVAKSQAEVEENPGDDEAFDRLCDNEAVLRHLRKQFQYIEERRSR